MPDGTGSVYGDTDWTWWYWVIISWYCLVLGDGDGGAGSLSFFLPKYIEISGKSVGCY